MDISYYKKYEPIDGKWYITKELGSGSFGTVFEIQRKDFPEMKSALKIISIPNSQNEVRSYSEENYDLDDKSVTSYFFGFVEEFIKEFKLMSQLKGNSNIVSYEDHDIKKHENGIGWDILIRMELLTPLGKYLTDNKPDQNSVIKLGIDICRALEVCQKYNIIHRDIKPSNIFVSDNGDFKLGDFGVARTLEKTSSGLSKKGTYTYMAPEVFKGEAYGASVDTYSLGIVMYKLLNNNLEPFRTDRTFNNGERAIELRMSGANMAKPQNANEELAAVILKACSFNPDERYQSPSQMREALENINNITENEEHNALIEEKEIDCISETNAYEKAEQNTCGEEKTISIFNENNQNGLSDDEIVKIAFAHEPFDFKSSQNRVFAQQCLSKIFLIYDTQKRISDIIRMNQQENITKEIKAADTDTLLVCFKSLAYFISVGEDKKMIGEVQGLIIKELRCRNLQTQSSGKTSANKLLEKQTKTKQPKKTVVNAGGWLKKYKRVCVISLAAVAAVLLCLLAFGRISTRETGTDDKNTLIELYPTAEVSDSELKNMADIVSERIKFLDTNYKVNVSDNKILVRLDNAFGSSEKIKMRIVDILSADGKMGISSFSWPSIQDCTENIEEITVESEEKDIFMRNYSDLLLEDTMEKITDEADDKIYYLHIKINGTMSVDFKKEVEDKSEYDDLTGIFDAHKHLSVFGGSAQAKWSQAGAIVNIDKKDYKEFILIPYEAASSEKAVNMLKYVLSSEQLNCSLEAVVSGDAEWETDESVFGQKQVASLEGNYIEVDYCINSFTAMYSEEYEKAIQTLKKRLDVVGLPYSIGYKGFCKSDLLLRISPEKFNADMLRFIAGNPSVSLYSQYNDTSVRIRDINIEKDESGKLCLKLSLRGLLSEDTTKDKIISEYLEGRNGYDEPIPDISEINPETENIYLVAGDVTVSETTLSEIQDDGTLIFSNLPCFGKQTIDDDEYWLLEIVKKYNDYQSSLNDAYISPQKITVSYYENGEFVTDDVTKIPWKYDNNEADSSIKKVVEKYGATVEKSLLNRNSLEIRLNIKKDGNFAETFMSTVEKIYTECNFDDCSYKEIRFSDTDAGKTNPTDAAEISFGKYSGKMKTHYDFFDGPTYGKYREQVKSIGESNDFYKSKM